MQDEPKSVRLDLSMDDGDALWCGLIILCVVFPPLIAVVVGCGILYFIGKLFNKYAMPIISKTLNHKFFSSDFMIHLYAMVTVVGILMTIYNFTN